MTTPATRIAAPPLEGGGDVSSAPAASRGRRGSCAARVLLLGALILAAKGADLPASEALPRVDTTASTIRFLEARVQSDPLDFVAQNRLAGDFIKMMRDTGDLAWLERAADSARASLAAVPGPRNPGGLTTMAVVELESHHFSEAAELSRLAYQADSRNTIALTTEGDAEAELGDYAEAEKIYRALADHDATPPVLARLAKLAEIKGRNGEAEDLLRHDPQAMLQSGVAPHDVAWYQVRLGELHFRTGDLEKAGAEYQTALSLWPESYAALEHLAELRGAQGRYDEAIALYKKVIERVPRAEFAQALGDLYAFMGKPDDARPWYERALSQYRKSVDQGNAHYLHHLAGYYCDSEENPAEALRWARRDMEVRHSVYAYDSLAWALYRNGDIDEALAATKKALAMGTKDAHLLYHAGLIYSRAGDWTKGRELLREAVAVNPRYNAFHMHR